MGVRGEHRNVYYAIGYNGHGVTLANIAGQVIADIYSGDDEKWRGLPFYQPAYKRIPPEPFAGSATRCSPSSPASRRAHRKVSNRSMADAQSGVHINPSV